MKCVFALAVVIQWQLPANIAALLVSHGGSFSPAGATTSQPNGWRPALDRLSLAVENGDVDAFDQLSKALREEALRQKRRRNLEFSTPDVAAKPAQPASEQQHHNRNSSRVLDLRADAPLASLAMKPSTGCVLDDEVFALTPASKAEIRQELQSAAMQEALTWVRTGGWWYCSAYGEVCTCHGDVRMVDWDRTKETSVKIDTRMLREKDVTCDIANFNNEDIRPGAVKVCECAHSAKIGEEGYHLHKRLTSMSYLQEAWIFLLRLLARTNLLPAGTGDRNHHGIENWAARRVPGHMPMVLERVWLEMFVKKVVAAVSPGPRCLEWGDPTRLGQGFNYAYMVPTCTQNFDMQFDAVFNNQKALSIEGNVVYSDIDHLPWLLMNGGDKRMNVIFATQVFEHVHNPEAAAKRLYESLLPGGSLVFTAPQQAQFHLVPHDFFRYTKEGALHLLTNAGFCVPDWAFAGGGDFIFDIARDAGLQVQDFPVEEIRASFQQGYHAVSDSAITVHVIAFKPPHQICHSSMPGLIR